MSHTERLWLTEILKSNFTKVDVKALKVKLWKKLPEDFDPKAIDSRLIRNNHLTLIGLWHVDPENVIFMHVSKAIEIMKDLIVNNRGIRKIKANEIGPLAGITERDAEIALMLIYDLGGFFGSATGSNMGHGFREAGFRENDSAYDEFLRFENLEQKMEQFFVSHAPITNVKRRELAGTQLMRTLNTFGKKESKDTWDDIQNDFDISKRAFGKKINFVTDKYKRKIIFRDIEHAYILAMNSFSKPAVILAGGVIEELLRLYLEQKNISPLSNSFDGYIKTCEQKRLLKSAIYRLSDSVRHFRNLVHLSREKTKKYNISKATAKGAVASIFTIANDF